MNVSKEKNMMTDSGFQAAVERYRKRRIAQTERGRVLRWVALQGVIISDDIAAQHYLDALVAYLRPAFPELERVHALFTYDMDQQPPVADESNCDGSCWRDVTMDGAGDLWAIGLSLQALDAGPRYAAFVLLHELTHVLVWDDGHGPHFQATLDSLVIRAQEHTGWIIGKVDL